MTEFARALGRRPTAADTFPRHLEKVCRNNINLRLCLPDENKANHAVYAGTGRKCVPPGVVHFALRLRPNAPCLQGLGT